MKTIIATHQTGTKMEITRKSEDLDRTIRLLSECGYTNVEIR